MSEILRDFSLVENRPAYIVRMTPEDAKELRRLYEKTKGAGKELFRFRGKDFSTSYAKYVLEYLDTRGTP